MMSRDEDLKKEFKKEFIYYGIFTFIGIAALISYAIGFEKSVMCGIAIGFIPTGIGGLLIYRKAKTHPGLAKNFKLERAVSYTHLRAHETRHDLVCRLLLEKKKNIKLTKTNITY